MNSSWIVFGVFVLTAITMIYLVMKKQYFQIKIRDYNLNIESFALGVIIGPILLLLLGFLDFTTIFHALSKDSAANPLGIIILFLSMVFLSIYLDNAGVIEYCARVALRFAGHSGLKLFFSLYIVVSVMTIFTSNDIIILTLTPFIYYFAKYAGIDPKPYLLAEFFAANTWSMMLHIGNPTNIYVASVYNITFLEYLKWMFFPTLIGGSVSVIVIYLLFKKQVNIEIKKNDLKPSDAIKDKFGAYIGTIILALCIISIAVSPYFGLDMWKVSFAYAILLLLIILIRDVYRYFTEKNPVFTLRVTLSRVPWSIVPFVLSFFIIVEALELYGITAYIGSLFSLLAGDSISWLIFLYGTISSLSANFLNNIPMTVAFSSIISTLSGKALFASSLAVIIGSNLGANITPLGALAGIMWMSILKNKDVDISFKEFCYYGIIVTIFTLLATLLVLAIEFRFFY